MYYNRRKQINAIAIFSDIHLPSLILAFSPFSMK